MPEFVGSGADAAARSAVSHGPAIFRPQGLGLDGWAEGAKDEKDYEPERLIHSHAPGIEAGWLKPAPGGVGFTRARSRGIAPRGARP